MGKGMTAKKKKHTRSTAKYLLSEKQLERVKYEVSKEATGKASLLNIAATADCFGLNEDQICELAETVTRYARYIDDHVVKINSIADIIEEKTSVRFSRF